MSNEKVTINVYNTITKSFENIEVEKDIAKVMEQYDRKEKYLTAELKTERAVKRKDGSIMYKPSKEISLNFLEDIKEFEFCSSDNVEGKIELRLCLEQALKHLTYEERKLVYLLYEKDLPQKEVAKIFNVSQQRINSKNKKILKKLKNFIKRGC